MLSFLYFFNNLAFVTAASLCLLSSLFFPSFSHLATSNLLLPSLLLYADFLFSFFPSFSPSATRWCCISFFPLFSFIPHSCCHSFFFSMLSFLFFPSFSPLTTSSLLLLNLLLYASISLLSFSPFLSVEYYSVTAIFLFLTSSPFLFLPFPSFFLLFSLCFLLPSIFFWLLSLLPPSLFPLHLSAISYSP